jgi:hypothetical protein
MTASTSPNGIAAANGDRPGHTADLDGLRMVPLRVRLAAAPVVWLPLGIGDRALVTAGDAVAAGTPLAERIREPTLLDTAPSARGGPPVDLPASLGPDRQSGEWIGDAGDGPVGELAIHLDGRWRVVTGEPAETIEAPAAGIVRDVRSGQGISLAIDGPAVPAVVGVGGPARGRLSIATESDGELRPSAIDVGRAGTILVAGSRVDAETLTRARAMGIRGVVVAALSAKDLRDFEASERRQSASLHRPPPFAVVVLDGALRRPIPSAIMAILAASEGREVGLVADPPALLLGPDAPSVPAPDPRHVRVRHGPLAGREGRWIGLAGLRRFRAGTHLEAGLVKLDEGNPIPIPLADLERFA